MTFQTLLNYKYRIDSETIDSWCLKWNKKPNDGLVKLGDVVVPTMPTNSNLRLSVESELDQESSWELDFMSHL